MISGESSRVALKKGIIQFSMQWMRSRMMRIVFLEEDNRDDDLGGDLGGDLDGDF